MLCTNTYQYIRSCAPVSGGVSRAWFADPDDWNFTQAAAAAAVGGYLVKPGYSVLARRAGATAPDAILIPIPFQIDEAQYTFKQSTKGCSTKYEHEFKCQLPQLSNNLTNLLMSWDASGCCCGLLIIIEMNDGKIFVIGEKYVNTTVIPRFMVRHDGSDGDSGKVYDDFNGANVSFKANYSRPPFEYTAAVSTLIAFES